MSTQPPASAPEAAGDGRELALRAALDRHERPLLRYALRLVGDPERARDVVQDTFLRLCDRAPEVLGEPDHMAGWLYRTCRNRALDVRKKENRMTTIDDMTLRGQPSAAPPPGHALERGELLQSVLRSIDRLPEGQKEALRLRFEGQLSYKEIADVTGQSVANVAFLIHVGMKSLRRKAARLEIGGVHG